MKYDPEGLMAWLRQGFDGRSLRAYQSITVVSMVWVFILLMGAFSAGGWLGLLIAFLMGVSCVIWGLASAFALVTSALQTERHIKQERERKDLFGL